MIIQFHCSLLQMVMILAAASAAPAASAAHSS
jgi:hypothetical protein